MIAVLDSQIILRGASLHYVQLHSKDLRGLERQSFHPATLRTDSCEVEGVLIRPEVLRKPRMTPVDAAARLEFLRRRSTVVTPAVRIARSRDPDDDKFLECAVAGGADYIVSAGADLLSLGEVQSTPIVEPPMFWLALMRDA